MPVMSVPWHAPARPAWPDANADLCGARRRVSVPLPRRVCAIRGPLQRVPAGLLLVSGPSARWFVRTVRGRLVRDTGLRPRTPRWLRLQRAAVLTRMRVAAERVDKLHAVPGQHLRRRGAGRRRLSALPHPHAEPERLGEH